jgi:hypothetical protein
VNRLQHQSNSHWDVCSGCLIILLIRAKHQATVDNYFFNNLKINKCSICLFPFNRYIDGVLIGSAPTPAGAGPYPALDKYFLGYALGTFWKGSVDDLRFYSRVLSAAEINTLANN